MAREIPGFSHKVSNDKTFDNKNQYLQPDAKRE